MKKIRWTMALLCVLLITAACGTGDKASEQAKLDKVEEKKEEPKKEEPKKEEPKKEEPKKEEPKKEEPVIDDKFTEEDGKLVALDTEHAPFQDMGLKTIIEKGKAGKATFIKTDLEGNEGGDYYIFDYANHMVEKYYFVSAMGSGYYNYYDLTAKDLVKVEDMDQNDKTEGLKNANRWDSTKATIEEDIQAIEDYFMKEHGMSIEDYVTK